MERFSTRKISAYSQPMAANNRILIWDIEPSHLTSQSPDAIAVIGQADFTSKDCGSQLTRN